MGILSLFVLLIVAYGKKEVAPIPAQDLAELLTQKRSNKGMDLATLSRLSAVLVVFLRHAGCTFCRQAIRDVAQLKRELEESQVRIVFGQKDIHFFFAHNLFFLVQISDLLQICNFFLNICKSVSICYLHNYF